jgi:hypothetical protein
MSPKLIAALLFAVLLVIPARVSAKKDADCGKAEDCDLAADEVCHKLGVGAPGAHGTCKQQICKDDDKCEDGEMNDKGECCVVQE